MQLYKDKFYIVSFEKIKKPFLLRNQFDSERLAYKAIKFNINPKKKKMFVIVSGSEALLHGLKFTSIIGKAQANASGITNELFIRKYCYPKVRKTLQKRKTYRTIMRRKKRKLNNT